MSASRSSTRHARATLHLVVLLVAPLRAESAVPPTASLVVEVTVVGQDTAELSGWLEISTANADDEPGMNVAVHGPTRVERSAPPRSVWRVTPVFEGYWGATEAVVAGGEPVIVRLFPTGVLAGEVEVPRGTPSPTVLRASFQPPPDVRRSEATARGSVDCPVASARWTCELPEGVHDLRLHALGFASALLWEVPVRAGDTATGGTLSLVPGGALIGRVEIDGPAPADGRPTVELRPVGTDRGDDLGGERLGYLYRSTEVGERGFFQFRDLSPGTYRIEATIAGRAPAQRTVEILEGRESDLGGPLVLQPPSRLEVFVDPAQAPDGRPWTLRLVPLDPTAANRVARADPTGYASIDVLAPGSYRLLVTTGSSSSWSHQRVEISGDLVHEIDLALVPVAGTVRQDGRPVRARIDFGDTHEYPERISIYSDDEGSFRGHLPREGDWPVAIVLEAGGAEHALEAVEVARSPGEEAARIELDLFATSIRGRVVDAAGRGVDTAVVSAWRRGSEAAHRTMARTDREGRFRLRSLAPGEWTLDALHRGDSARVTVDLAEGAEEDIEIRLAGTREISGVVLSPRGPVAAAWLYLIPELDRVFPLSPVKTGPLGEFEERVPSDSPRVHLLVLPPGFAARILSLELPADGGAAENVEVSVGELGGTLRLELPARGASGVELRRGNTRVHLRLLADWAGFHGSPPRPGSPWMLAGMEPGAYELCYRGRCDAGFLDPGGQLVLSLPEAPRDETEDASVPSADG